MLPPVCLTVCLPVCLSEFNLQDQIWSISVKKTCGSWGTCGVLRCVCPGVFVQVCNCLVSLCRGRTELLCLLQVSHHRLDSAFTFTYLFPDWLWLILFFLPANQTPSYPSSGGVASCRTASLRPESFLFRLGQKEEKRKGETGEVIFLSCLPVTSGWDHHLTCKLSDQQNVLCVLQVMLLLLRARMRLLLLLLWLEKMLSWWSSSERFVFPRAVTPVNTWVFTGLQLFTTFIKLKSSSMSMHPNIHNSC